LFARISPSEIWLSVSWGIRGCKRFPALRYCDRQIAQNREDEAGDRVDQVMPPGDDRTEKNEQRDEAEQQPPSAAHPECDQHLERDVKARKGGDSEKDVDLLIV